MKRSVYILPLSVIVFCALVASAWAAGASVKVSNGRVVFSGSPGASSVTVSKQGGDYSWLVSDSIAMSAGTNCRKQGSDVECKGAKKAPVVNLAAGNDQFTNKAASAVTASGQKGQDYLRGFTGADLLSGGPSADLVYAGTGPNTISGNSGPDILLAAGGGKQTVRCSDNDLVVVDSKDLRVGCRASITTSVRRCSGLDYIWRTGNRKVKLSSGEDLAWGGSGQENLRGMQGNDCLFGDGNSDRLYGEEGSDIIASGKGYRDLISGGIGRDYLFAKSRSASVLAQDGAADYVFCARGDLVVSDSKDIVRGCSSYRVAANVCTSFVGSSKSANKVVATFPLFVRLDAGNDSFTGSDGGDCAFGDSGLDVLRGGDAADLLSGGSGADALYGGPSNDRILSRDNDTKDTVSCGSGNDSVVADRVDSISRDCEKVYF